MKVTVRYAESFALLSGKGRMQSKFKILVKSMAGPLVVGAVSGFLARGGIEKYETWNRVFLSPPGWLFPMIWMILYLLMGAAAYLVRTSKAEKQHIAEAVTIYNLLLFVQFLWIIFFFVLELQIFAFAWLIVLWLLAAVTVILFYSAKKPAGVLMLFYLLWTTYTGYLNLAFCILQIGMMTA